MQQLKRSDMDWDNGTVPEAPSAPENLQQTGLTLGFLSDLILRTLYARGGMLGLDLSRLLCLPFKIIEEALTFLKNEKCVEVLGGDLIGRISYRFNLTELGRRRAQEAMAQCAYVGPAPVPLEDYVEQVYRQAVTAIDVSPESLRAAFGHLVVSEDLFNAVGPAIVSGKSVFIYGPPGNGKTAMAQAIGAFMNACGGEIFVPYAFLAENNIITVFDQAVHEPAEEDAGDAPGRQRGHHPPLAQHRHRRSALGEDQASGHRHRRRIEPDHARFEIQRPKSNYYQAPMHVKANGGVFLIDDFGRQLCSPKELLNRWIVPLENRVDYLSLASGQKFQVPFEQLTMFSTNLDPKDLVDDAFLRRMRHKLEIMAPKRDIYERIFNSYAKRLGMNQCPAAIDYLYEQYYNRGRCPRASDCRDLLETVQSICRFRRMPVQLTRELIAEAASSFIREFQ